MVSTEQLPSLLCRRLPSRLNARDSRDARMVNPLALDSHSRRRKEADMFVLYTKHAREFIPQIKNHLTFHSLYSFYSTIFAKK
jgi:hypothetical protein